MRFRDLLPRQQSEVVLLPRQQSEVELERALNRALIFHAVNKIVDLQNEYKANMGEVEVAAATVFDMAQAENETFLNLTASSFL